MIAVTRYNTGLAVDIDPDTIMSLQELPAGQSFTRTRIWTEQFVLIVRESIDEIGDLMKKESPVEAKSET